MEMTLTEKRVPGVPRSILFWLVLFLLMLFTFPLVTSLAEGPSAAPVPLDPQTTTEHEMLTRINEVRASYGLAPFSMNSLLSQAAEAHAAEGRARDWLSHRGADGSSYYDRVARAGYQASRVNETIGWGYNLERMLNWWLNSPVHRSILLSPSYSEIGIGYLGDPSARWGHWWVVNVAAP